MSPAASVSASSCARASGQGLLHALRYIEDCATSLCMQLSWIIEKPHQIGHGTSRLTGTVARRPRLSLAQPQVPVSQAPLLLLPS